MEYPAPDGQMTHQVQQGTQRLVDLRDSSNLWDTIGTDQGLKTDADIAGFLVKFYKDNSGANQTTSCCVNCLSPLTLYCSKCGSTDQPGGGIKMPPPGSVPKQPKLTMPQRIRHVPDDDDDDVDLLASDPASPTAEQVARTMVQLAFTTEEPPTPVITTDNSDNKDMHACPHCGVKFAHMNGLTRHLSLQICYTKTEEPVVAEIRPVRTRNLPTDKIKCRECSLEFTEEDKLRDHMKVHTEAMPYVCCHCGVGFLEKTVLSYHLKMHQGLHVCHRCGSEFVNKHGLTAHLKMEICTQDEARESDEALDEASNHSNPPVKKKRRNQFYVDKNTCKFCSKKLASPSHLKRHILSHTGERPYVCQSCGAAFTQKSRLIDHHNRAHAADKPIKCGTCSMKFFTTKEYNKHICNTNAFDELEYEADSQSGDSRPFKCQYCNAEFAYSTHLTAHIQTHTGMKEFRCPHCDKAFGDNRYLKQHLRKHNRPKPIPGAADIRKYKCHICPRAFKTRKTLTVHIRVHTGEKPYQCQECGKRFAQRGNYRSHMRVHTGEKPFTCEQCGQSFAHRTTYVGHVRAHTGLKPYKCKHCDKTFRQSYSLNIHMRTHTHEKPYTCNQCNSAFSHPSSLTIHMRKHTGEKPFRCPHCDQNFASASNCRAHIRKTHKDDHGTPIRDGANSQSMNNPNRKPRVRKPKQDKEKYMPVETSSSSCAQIQVPQAQPLIPEQQQPQQQQQQQHIPQAFRPEAIPVYGLWDGLRPPLQFPPPPPDAHSGPTLQMQAVWNDFRQPHDLSHPRTHPQWN